MQRDGRFAPSPTGDLHLGNLRTALIAWLYARSARARFLVRMEDLDLGRVRDGSEERQLGDLARLGLDWDGAVVRQSERTTLYREAVAQLEREGLVYRCWCTRAEIRAAVSAPHGAGSAGDAYAGTCRHLNSREQISHEASGRPPALRVAAHGARVGFRDRNTGAHEGTVDDFVVRRNDGAFAYNLAVAVDDAEQGIGEVVRGADLLSSTPRQIWLLRQLGLPVPRYAHVPLLLDGRGGRVAKRTGGETRGQRAAAGQSAAALRAELAASAGLIDEDEGPFPLEALLERFDPERLVAPPPRADG